MTLSEIDLDDLRLAKRLLDRPGLAAKLSDAVGSPIEKGLELLPERWSGLVTGVASKAVERALEVAIATLRRGGPRPSSDRWHKLLAGTTGAVGGAFGLPGLAADLPLSTTIILRSIADIARAEGEDLGTPEGRIACVQVLALGGRTPEDDAVETGYFAVRAAMAQVVSEAVRHVAERGVAQPGAPALVRLISSVASRFSVNVTQKAAAQAVPAIGAVGGAVVNTLFIDHFQDVARGHFVVRRLERAHGREAVEEAYRTL